MDLNGFGGSAKDAERPFSIEEYHRDIATLLEQGQEGLPMFVLAQGFGAGLLLSFLILNQRLNIAGVIVSNAMVRCPEGFRRSLWQELLIKAIAEDDEVVLIKLFEFFLIFRLRMSCSATRRIPPHYQKTTISSAITSRTPIGETTSSTFL